MDRQNFVRTLIPRFTSFRNVSLDPKTYTQTIEALSTDEVRNNLIVEDVRKVIDEGRTPIILTNLTSHVRILAEMLQTHATHVVSLVGADSPKNKRMAMEKLENIPAIESLSEDKIQIHTSTTIFVTESYDQWY